MGAKLSVLRQIMSFSPYLRSAMVRFPLENILFTAFLDIISNPTVSA